MELDERLVVARLRLGSFFPGAWHDAEDGWQVPERAVRHCLRCTVQPLFSIASAADILGLSYDHLRKQTATVASLDAPLPPGKRIRALLIFLGEGTEKRIPECELNRVQGLRRAAA